MGLGPTCHEIVWASGPDLAYLWLVLYSVGGLLELPDLSDYVGYLWGSRRADNGQSFDYNRTNGLKLLNVVSQT